jgi:hypothetical protein
MKVRVKMEVVQVKKSQYKEKVKLQAVYSDHPSDNPCTSGSPKGTCKITIDREEAFGLLLPGECYFIDFTKAE